MQMSVGPAGDGIIPYGSGHGVAASGGFGGAVVPNSSGIARWGGPYDPSLARG